MNFILFEMLQAAVLICVAVILSVLVIAANSESVESRPKVTLDHGGILIGGYMKTNQGNAIRAFKGVPYAKPPIGELRFSAPVPADSWTGEKLASEDTNICPQQNSYERDFVTTGDEDCLYLNVYVPQINGEKEPLSVMVYIHGGGWMTGSGKSSLYGPQKLLDYDVILVTGNYRLGALGFLSTGTADCPGNFGLKDQVLILKWVQENIKAFGGNPSDVTIFGESAGAGSVGHHIFSSASKGLFHKAILQSGTNFNEWAIADKTVMLERTEKVATLLNCSMSKGNWAEVVNCLRTKSATDIASIVSEHFSYDSDPAVIYPAVIESDAETGFLTKLPQDISTAPSIHVPIMIGITAEEGAMKSGSLLNLRNDDFISRFTDALPVLLFYEHFPKDIQKQLTERIDEFYFKGKRDWSKTKHYNLTNVFTDNWFAWGQDKFLRNRFSASEVPVGSTYVYLFDHRGPKSLSEFFHAGLEYYGVCHTDELPYLFNYKLPEIDGDENDRKMKKLLPLLWTNFAKTGNPTPDDSTVPKWKPAYKFPLQYAHIGRKTSQDWTALSNEIGLLDERMQFWRNLEKLYE